MTYFWLIGEQNEQCSEPIEIFEQQSHTLLGGWIRFLLAWAGDKNRLFFEPVYSLKLGEWSGRLNGFVTSDKKFCLEKLELDGGKVNIQKQFSVCLFLVITQFEAFPYSQLEYYSDVVHIFRQPLHRPFVPSRFLLWFLEIWSIAMKGYYCFTEK